MPDKADAIKIASDVSDWWSKHYGLTEGDDVDNDLYGDMIFNFFVDDLFHVFVTPTVIREPGESAKP